MRTQYFHHSAPTRRLLSFVGACCFFAASSFAEQGPWTEWTAAIPDRANIAEFPSHYRAIQIDLNAVKASLVRPAAKGIRDARILLLPRPDGGSQAFEVTASGVLPAALAHKYPELQAFSGVAVDDPSTTVRFELHRNGLRAQVLGSRGRWIVDPIRGSAKNLSISYYSADLKRSSARGTCRLQTEDRFVPKGGSPNQKKSLGGQRAARSSGATLRTYQIAVATTGEYGVFHGGTTPDALAAVVTTINRVTGILEKELSISLQLISNNDEIIFIDPSTDPFSGNDNANDLIEESQQQIDLIIGSDNYDVGHTFSTGAGGLADLGSVCASGFKAQGVTGSGRPEGQFFDVDFVAHEIGHQLGADHTFNGSNGNCTNGSRYYLSAYEPGSGSTIQAYAGLCSADNLQGAADPIYHSASFDEITLFLAEGEGGSCGVVTSTNNTPPSVDAGADYSVPKATPLVITGSGSDAEQNALTYLWEQRDLGPQAALSAGDDGEIPLFRVLTPQSNPSRYLPALGNVVSGNYSDAEKLPQLARELDMRLTVRDGAGGVASDDMVIFVTASAGPFVLTSPNGGENVGASSTIGWDPAGTTASPVNVSEIEILLSIDGGATFDRSLGTTANDGFEVITFPSGITTNSARLMLRAVNNIFYDVSDDDFVLKSDRLVPPAPTSLVATPLDGGVRITFEPGIDNGVPVTSYEAVCSTESVSETFSKTIDVDEFLDESTEVSSTLTFDNALTIDPEGLLIPVDITHSYRGDVVIDLTSPAGTTIRLKDDNGADASADVIGTFPLSLAPSTSLDAFVGENAAGKWRMSVSDVYNGDFGTVNAWGVSVIATTPGLESSITGIASPLIVSDMANDEVYSCQITAYAGNDPSEIVIVDGIIPRGESVTYSVTPSAGANGSISPSSIQSVVSGETAQFTLGSDNGYQIAGVGGSCGGSLSGSTYTTSAITSDCTVAASFEPVPVITYSVTPSAGANGSISPSSIQSVVSGETAQFTLGSDNGYQIAGVGGSCGGSLSGSTYTTSAITSDCTVVASFEPVPVITYSVTPSAGANGSISPSSIQSVVSGETAQFTLGSDNGYQIAGVGGSCGGSLSGSTYTTSAITSDCTVVASFEPVPKPARCTGPEPCVPEIISVDRYDVESMSASVTLAGSSENDPTPLEISTWCVSEALPDYTLLAVENVVDAQNATSTAIPLAASGEPPYLCYFTAANEAGTSEQPNYVNYANRHAFNHVTVMAPDDFRETIQGKIQLMYIGLLQRAADRAGLAYWSRDFYNGVSVDGIRASFVPSEEFQTFWGDRDRGEFLNALYRIYFNREPDQAGFDYWVSGGGSGVRVDQLAQTFIDAAGVVDQLALENKAFVASHYTSLYASYDRDAIKAILETVDSTEESVTAAIQAINENYTAAH